MPPKQNPKYPVPVPEDSGMVVPVQTYPYGFSLGPSVYEAAMATASFINNFRKMRTAGYIDGDKYYHCKANARSAQLGPYGYVTARILSDGREFTDNFKYKLKSEDNDAGADQEANYYGRKAGSLYPKADPGELCLTYRPPALPKKYW